MLKPESRQIRWRTIALPLLGALIAGVLFMIAWLAGAGPASAQTMGAEPPAPMVIEADSAGNIVIRGWVTSVDANSLTIESWGGTWTILTGAGSSVVPLALSGIAGELSGISVGDFIGVDGAMADGRGMTIDARFVRDWTTDPLPGAFEGEGAAGTSFDASVDADEGTSAPADTSTPDAITYSGTVDRVDDTSFTFTDDFDSTYTVTVDDSVGVTDSDGDIRALADIAAGDTVELDGVADGGAISTSLVRITSE